MLRKFLVRRLYTIRLCLRHRLACKGAEPSVKTAEEQAGVSDPSNRSGRKVIVARPKNNFALVMLVNVFVVETTGAAMHVKMLNLPVGPGTPHPPN